MNDFDDELQKINDELLSLSERKNVLVRKRKALKLKHIYPYEIVYPVTIPFKWFIGSITHLRKEECSRISVRGIIQKGTTSVSINSYVPLSIRFKHILVPRPKGLKNRTHLLVGRFIIEGIVPRPSSMKYLCASCGTKDDCWLREKWGDRDSCGSYEEVTVSKEDEKE